MGEEVDNRWSDRKSSQNSVWSDPGDTMKPANCGTVRRQIRPVESVGDAARYDEFSSENRESGHRCEPPK